MKTKKPAPTHFIDDELIIEVKSAIKVNLRDLNINPNDMPPEAVKKALAREIDFALRTTYGLSPVAHQLKLLSITTKSKRIYTDQTDDKSIE